jgi:hypothetical protein
MKKIIYIALFSVIFFVGQSVNAQTNSGKFTIDLTGKQKVYTQSINKDLLLRVVKDSSVKNKDFGWIIEVVKKPYRKNSRNLIYQNKTGTTADLSQVYAWHIGNGEFPNSRTLKAKGYPLIVKIKLINPKTKGEAENAKFVSGKLQISWKR